jgi:hypothetical protein
VTGAQDTSRLLRRPYLRSAVAWLALAAIVVASGTLLLSVLQFALLRTGRLSELMLQHFAAVVGLPCAALASLGLVLFLESHSGHD